MPLRAALVLALVLAGCDPSEPAPPPSEPPPEPPPVGNQCARADYPDWRTSDYVLPYPVGRVYPVLQGNCGSFSHVEGGNLVFSYDFTMRIGEVVTASRAGTVIWLEERYQDGDNTPGHENGVIVQHADGTAAYYVHFTRNGARVELDEAVARGDTLGFSGNTGFSTKPHLHFAVYERPCDGGPCTPLPTTFSNAGANATGLQQGRAYAALPYGPGAP